MGSSFSRWRHPDVARLAFDYPEYPKLSLDYDTNSSPRSTLVPKDTARRSFPIRIQCFNEI